MKDETKQADLEVTACYYPYKGEADITFEDKQYNKRCYLEGIKLTPEQGQSLAETVLACVYYTANRNTSTVKQAVVKELEEILELIFLGQKKEMFGGIEDFGDLEIHIKSRIQALTEADND